MTEKLIWVTLSLLLFGSAVGLAASPYDRVAYYDENYPTHWVTLGDTTAVRDACEDAGYRIVDADELKEWMDARIVDGRLSVVIICQDVFPETVAETNSADCTLRQYLDAGGKVVFFGDIPLYNQGNPGGGETNWGGGGSVNILGFNAAGAAWDSNNEVTITEAGTLWGLTTTWTSVRPAAPDAWENMTVLATDDAGNAAAWVAHYVPGDTFRGFVRVWDRGPIAEIQDLIRLAEYAEDVEMATAPVPDSGATDVPRDAVLSWTSGTTAATHDVYFGTSFEDVNAATRDNPLGVLVSEGQSENTYDPPGLLEFGTTYYWRIDEVNGAPDFTIFRGEIWSFTAEPLAYPVTGITATSNAVSEADAGPENTINGSGLNDMDEHSTFSFDMWMGVPAGADPVYIQYEFDRVYKLHEMLVWNYNVQFELILGFGLKDVTVEYSENGTDWIALGDVELAQATAQATYTPNTIVDLQGVGAKFVRLTVNSGHGVLPQYGLSEVRFLYIPAHAREPQPADGAGNVPVDAELAWRAGRDAVSHEVYLGTEAGALELAGTPADAAFAPGDLSLGTTYYWRVDETSDSTWEGSTWSFSTRDYLVVDDFESYDDEDNTIFDTWIDGLVNGTGSIVGYFESPFAEQTIVHGGGQSMPLEYNNAGGAVSEAEFDVGGQDWSANGIESLTLHFYGSVTNSIAQLYVKINNTRIDYDGRAINITRPSWHLWSIDLSQAGNVSNVNTLTIGVEGAGATGLIFVDDVRLYPEVFDYLSPDVTGAGDTVQGVPNDDDWPAGETPDLAIDDDTGTKFLHFKGHTEPTGIQITPLLGATTVTEITFTTANDAPARDPASFELYGSNAGIDGPYTLIANGEIVDFTQADPWPRFTKNATPITFDNSVAYTHYQVLFPTVRDPGSANSMQIAEVELIGATTP